MKTQILLMASMIVGAAGARASDAAAFARLKTLAGEWQADTDMGKVRASYEVIAGGTAVVERESGEKMPAMLTVYHLDGDRLLLTHYCVTGNQPRMQARRFDPESGELAFEFLDATNLSPGGGHMHNARIRFLDDRHFSAEWEFFENGQKKMAHTAEFTRVR